MTNLVQIEAQTLKLAQILDIPESETLRVLAILGKARMGKSTFLNAIANRFVFVKPPFETRDDENHCTRGVDYYYCKEQNLLLLDSQGLSLEDSSHEPKLLLFLYHISDVIIVNERMMLQNEVLKLLEPICAFTTTFDTTLDPIKPIKPKLIFRISDGDMIIDLERNLQKVMAPYDDQYQSIRDSIQHLFQPELTIVKTDTPDKKTKIAIRDGHYNVLLDDETFGFKQAIDTILSCLPDGRKGSDWIQSLYPIADAIQKNEKVSLEKLDVVAGTAKQELDEWLTTIPADVFSELVISDGTQTTFRAVVEPRQVKVRALLEAFQQRFTMVAPRLKDPVFQDLSGRQQAPIESAVSKMTELAESAITELYKTIQPMQFEVSNDIQSFGKRDFSVFTDQLGFTAIKIAIANLYEPVKQKYETTMINLERDLIQHIHAARLTEAANIQRIQDYFREQAKASTEVLVDECTNLTDIASYHDIYDLHHFSESPIKTKLHVPHVNTQQKWAPGKLVSMLTLPITAILKELYMKRIAVTMEKIGGMFEVQAFQIKSTATELAIERMLVNSTIDASYDLLQEPYQQFVQSLTHCDERNKQLMEVLTARKESLVYQKIYENCDFISRIVDIKFVKLQTLFISHKTFMNDYQPLFTQVIDRMLEKQYIRVREDIQLDFVFYIKDGEAIFTKRPNITTVAIKAKNQYVLRLFYHMRDKVFAKAIATNPRSILPITAFKELL